MVASALNVALIAGLWAGAAALLGPAPDSVAPVEVRPSAGCARAGQAQPDYACLNAALAADAHAAAPASAHPSAADLLGTGAPDKVGVFSFTGTAQQLGSSFGHSAFPQRPARTPAYHPPLAPIPVVRPR